nr:branched-chain amino acid transport system II carrier protein [Verrucomicrobiae bacterium]
MSLTHIKKIIITGLAMFAMLFGSGNVIFPLILGKDSGNQLSWGLFGFLIT